MHFFKAWRSRREKAPAGCTALTGLYQSSQWLMHSLKSQLQNFFSASISLWWCWLESEETHCKGNAFKPHLSREEWDVMIYQCKAQRSLLLSCSRHWGSCGFFIENCMVGGQFSRMSHSKAQSGKCLIPLEWLRMSLSTGLTGQFQTGLKWEGRKRWSGVLGRLHTTRVFSTWQEMSLHVLCKILSHHKESGRSGKFSPSASSHVCFSLFSCSFKTFKGEGWWCESNGLSSGASDSNIHFIL